MVEGDPVVARRRGLPLPLWLWVAAAAASQLGSGMLQLALTWTASGIGAELAGWLLTASTAPSLLLLLIGGSLGDRLGQRRLLVVCTAASMVQYATFLALLHVEVPLTGLLLGNAVVSGVLQGIRAPSSTVYARSFVPPAQTPRAVATTTTAAQAASVIAPALGGVLIAYGGLELTLWVDLAGFAVILAALLTLTPSHAQQRSRTTESVVASIRGGFASWWEQKDLVALLLAVGIVAGGLLPVISVALPLTVRAHGWTAREFGWLQMAWTAATLTTSLVIAAAGPSAKPGRFLIGGPVLTAVGIAALAASPTVLPALVSMTATGVGVMLFTGHVSPLFIYLTPDGMLSRYSAILQLVQVLPVAIIGPLLGNLIASQGLAIGLAFETGIAILGALTVASSPRLRAAYLPRT